MGIVRARKAIDANEYRAGKICQGNRQLLSYCIIYCLFYNILHMYSKIA